MAKPPTHQCRYVGLQVGQVSANKCQYKRLIIIYTKVLRTDSDVDAGCLERFDLCLAVVAHFRDKPVADVDLLGGRDHSVNHRQQVLFHSVHSALVDGGDV